MTKLLSVTTELNHCSECIYILDWFDTGLRDERCRRSPRGRGYRILGTRIWGEIPKWCPLPDKEVSNG